MSETAEKLKKWFKDKSIELILFDLDDTFLDTHQTFMIYYEKFSNIIKGKVPNATEDEIRENNSKFLREAHEIYAVNPGKIWTHIISRFEEHYSISLGSEAVKVLTAVYDHLPPLYEGALETLETLKQTGVKLGIMTHALEEWTMFKIKGHNLGAFFDRIDLADVDKLKDFSDWKRAIDNFGVKPVNTIVVGDNVSGDIISAHSIGVKNVVWINNSRGWEVYRTGELPEGTIVIKGIHELVDKLLEDN